MNTDSMQMLDQVDVATPCPMSWDDMEGDETSRFCADCRLTVYNLSGMTREDAERLVFEREGRVCVRFYRRSDGTVLTSDCPVGLRMLRKRIAGAVATIAAVVAFMTGGLVFASILSQRQPGPTAGAGGSGPLTTLINWIDPPQPAAVMGDMCLPPPTVQTPPIQSPTAGGESETE